MAELSGMSRAPENGALRVLIAAARFNEFVVRRLVDGALAELKELGLADENVTLAWAPGAFELPLVARAGAESGRFDAVVCLGAVIRGETDHYQFVAGEAARGIADAAASTGVPVMFGVLTVDNLEQALERSGGKVGNKGAEAARGAVEMAHLLRRLRPSSKERA